MSYVPPGMLAAVALLIISGSIDRVVHLSRTFSTALPEAKQRIHELPSSIGSWVSEPTRVNDGLLKPILQEGGQILRYRDGKTGHSVQVALLAGHPGLMTDQLPEEVFPSLGYAPDRAGVRPALLETRLGIDVPGMMTRVDFWTRDSAFPTRVWLGWFDGARWSRPHWPRWSFLGKPALYRLQVWSPLVRDPFAKSPKAVVDPGEEFLKQALPRITRLLAGAEATP